MYSGKGKQLKRGVKGFACCHKAVLGTAKHGIQGIFLAFLLCNGHFLHSKNVLLWKCSCKTILFKSFNSNTASLQAPGDDSE